jgi:RNA ligase (TIGR02306 family)
MSEFHCPVIRLGEIVKHENADTLGVTNVFAYPSIVRLGDFKPGDLAAYIPVDAIVPTTDPHFSFLEANPHTKNGQHRIKAMRLRGIFSMGLLIHADQDWAEGEDVTERLKITKYEPPQPLITGGDNETDPGFLPVYTDVEGLRRWPDIIAANTDVILTEKLHGANGRFLWKDGRLWVGSHLNIKKEDSNSVWWRAANQYGLADKLSTVPDIALYGEVFGSVQDLHYGCDRKKGEIRLAFFDALDTKTREYLNWPEFKAMLEKLGLPMVPIIHEGPWDQTQVGAWSNGKSLMPGADNVREGFVMRPITEAWDPRIQRTILKMLGEDYLTRKEGAA